MFIAGWLYIFFNSPKLNWISVLLTITFLGSLCILAHADEEMQPIAVTGLPRHDMVINVLSKGVQHGSFIYKIPKFNISRVVEVDAGVGGDVEAVMLDKMIKIIQQQYSGNFKFVGFGSLDANDTELLRAVLKREFFGTMRYN